MFCMQLLTLNVYFLSLSVSSDVPFIAVTCLHRAEKQSNMAMTFFTVKAIMPRYKLNPCIILSDPGLLIEKKMNEKEWTQGMDGIKIYGHVPGVLLIVPYH